MYISKESAFLYVLNGKYHISVDRIKFIGRRNWVSMPLIFHSYKIYNFFFFILLFCLRKVHWWFSYYAFCSIELYITNERLTSFRWANVWYENVENISKYITSISNNNRKMKHFPLNGFFSSKNTNHFAHSSFLGLFFFSSYSSFRSIHFSTCFDANDKFRPLNGLDVLSFGISRYHW